MDKLYYLVCEDKDTTLFEGRFQGRTRGAALKHLKRSLGRPSLNGLVYTVTEIPVPLIREIVAEMLAGGDGSGAANIVPIKAPEPEPKVERFDPATPTPEPKATPADTPPADDSKVGNPGHGDELWSQARAYWEECRNLRETARKFGLSPNTVKTRARRENWKGDTQ